MAEMDLFEAIYTARAIRRFKPDPVPDEVITKVLDAAIRAPSGSNEQSWEFIVVKDAAQRKKIGAVYRKGGNILMALYANRTKPPHMSQETYDKLMSSAMYLLDHMADAPVLLLACLKQTPPAGRRRGIEEHGEDGWLEHLSRGAKYHPRLPRLRTRHRAHDHSHVLRRRS